MNILDRYIARHVIEATLLALLVLLGLQLFINFVGELHDIGTKDYGIKQALIYVPLQLPGSLYQFFPMAGLIGSLMGLGRLASHSELIVMRAAGVSVTQITMAVLKAAILLLVFATLMGEWAAPHTERYADHQKAVWMSGGQAVNTQMGVWVRDGNTFIHINQVMPHGILSDVTSYTFQDHQLVVASHAQTGLFQQGKWIFQNVDQSHLTKDHVSNVHLDQESWQGSFNPRLLSMAVVDPSQETLTKLYDYVQYLKKTRQSSSHSEFVFWKRIFQPLATLIMICLGVPFILGPLRTVTMGLRILTAIVIGFGFYMLNEFFGPLSMVYQLPPLLAAALPAVLFAFVGGALLWKMR